MGVNTFPFAALIFIGLLGTTAAAPLPFGPDSEATIQGHDVYSRFLPGAYVIAPGATDDGSGIHGSDTAHDPDAFAPMLQSDPTVSAALVRTRSFASVLPVERSDGDVRSVFNGSGSGAGGATQGSSGAPTQVGTVPLPPALPLFGAAVLGLTAFGRSRKRRAAKA